MASYAALPVLAGYSFDMAKGVIGFDPKIHHDGKFRSLWSTGTGWGEVRIEDGVAVIEVIGGALNIAAITVQDITFDTATIAAAAQTPIKEDRIALGAGAVITLRDPTIHIARNQTIYAM